MEGRWAEKWWDILPGEEPLILGRCNYDTLSPKHCGNVAEMEQGFADEAVVVVKLSADEVAVTLLRVKHSESNKDAGDEERNTKAKLKIY